MKVEELLTHDVHEVYEGQQCPIRLLLSKLTGKWDMLIVIALQDGPLRFGALKREVGEITQRVLTDRLRTLESLGILTRHVEPGPPLAVYYELTEMGKSYLKVLYPMIDWAIEQLANR